jgi:copper chaperone CopZ
MCDSNGNHEICTCDTASSGAHEHSHDHSEHTPSGSDHSRSAAVTTDYGVEGMTCSHCVASVTEELSQLEGVSNVDIDLVAGGISRVRVGSSRALADAEVAAAVDEAGYELATLPR